MAYDHNEKAGNQGDVIKHIALLAAVDTILTEEKRKAFRYCDTFAGYAVSQLIHGNGWKDGIGLFFNTTSPDCETVIHDKLNGNAHVEQFRDLYLAGRPGIIGRMYPGSSLIVHDLCLQQNVKPEFSLWDISPSAIASLMTTYKGTEHSINPRPATCNEQPIEDADFVFIDPPKAPMTRSGGLCWGDMIQFLKPQHKNFMFWLPIDFRSSKGEMIENTKQQREDALIKGLDALEIRWKIDENSLRTVGCQLFYRFSDSAKSNLEAAVRHICDVLNWTVQVTKVSAEES